MKTEYHAKFDCHIWIWFQSFFLLFQIEQYLSLSKDIKIRITPNEMYRIHELILKHKEELVSLLYHYVILHDSDKHGVVDIFPISPSCHFDI